MTKQNNTHTRTANPATEPEFKPAPSMSAFAADKLAELESNEDIDAKIESLMRIKRERAIAALKPLSDELTAAQEVVSSLKLKLADAYKLAGVEPPKVDKATKSAKQSPMTEASESALVAHLAGYAEGIPLQTLYHHCEGGAKGAVYTGIKSALASKSWPGVKLSGTGNKTRVTLASEPTVTVQVTPARY